MDGKIFEFIAKHGHPATDRRAAKKDPAWAERHAARRVRPGIVLGTEGPGGLDGFFADITIASKHRPWWWKITLHIHWWLGKYGPRATKFNITCFWQRGKRGYSDRDLWGFHSHLTRMIRDGVKELNRTKHGWPGEPLTFEGWGQILDEIVEGMDAAMTLDSLDYDFRDPEARKALEIKHNLAMDHLKTWWFALWD